MIGDPKRNASEEAKKRREARKAGKKKAPKKRLKAMSKKKAVVVADYIKAKAKKQEDFLTEHGYLFCEGCGRSDVTVNPSHLIPQSVRQDLIADVNNIHYHCQGGCHDLCELGEWDSLLDGDYIKDYIMEKDIEYFNLKYYK